MRFPTPISTPTWRAWPCPVQCRKLSMGRGTASSTAVLAASLISFCLFRPPRVWHESQEHWIALVERAFTLLLRSLCFASESFWIEGVRRCSQVRVASASKAAEFRWHADARWRREGLPSRPRLAQPLPTLPRAVHATSFPAPCPEKLFSESPRRVGGPRPAVASAERY